MSCLKVICWAFIFIFKLHFPPGVSIAAVLYVYTYTLYKVHKQLTGDRVTELSYVHSKCQLSHE